MRLLAACVLLGAASAGFLRRSVEEFHPGARSRGELRFKRLRQKEGNATSPVSTLNASNPLAAGIPGVAGIGLDGKPVTSVWVLGWGRAGTTLAMDLLGAGTDKVFTLFEPCHIGGSDVYRGQTITPLNVQQLCPQLLIDVMRCDFSGMQGMRHLKLNAKHNEGNVPNFFSPKAMEATCRSAKMRIVKTVHIDETVITTAGMGAVLSAVPHLKVVSVVRDPRAVYSSREQCHIAWHKSWVNTHPALFDRMCSQLEDAHYWPVHYPQRVRTLRYETLVQQPKQESNAVLKFLGLPVGTPRVTKWLKTHMGAPECADEDADEYGTCRTPAQQKAALTKWRHLLSLGSKAHADLVCGQVLQSFQYSP